MKLSYKQLQTALKQFRAEGKVIKYPLNSKQFILEHEYARLTAESMPAEKVVDEVEEAILGAFTEYTITHINDICRRTGIKVTTVAAKLNRLISIGKISQYTYSTYILNEPLRNKVAKFVKEKGFNPQEIRAQFRNRNTTQEVDAAIAEYAATQPAESLEDSIVTLVAEGAMPVAEIRRKFPVVSKEEMDKVLTELHYSDRINLFTGEATNDYYEGVFLPNIPNPRTWVMPA